MTNMVCYNGIYGRNGSDFFSETPLTEGFTELGGVCGGGGARDGVFEYIYI